MSPNEIEDLVDEIVSFIKGNGNKRCARQWFQSSLMKVYIRRGIRNYDSRPNAAHNIDSDWFSLEPAFIPTLEIASIDVYKPGCGTFTKFLQKIEERSPLNFIYIENILEDRLYNFLKRKGYKVYRRPEERCLYKCI